MPRRSSFIRYFLYSIASTVLLLVLTLFTVLYCVDPNRLRDPLLKLLNQHPKMTINFEKLEWKSFPLLGIKAHHVSLLIDQNPISIESLEIYPDLTALLRKRRIEITSLLLQKPIIDYKALPALQTKAPVLTHSETVPIEPTSHTTLGLHIKHLRIQDAEILWNKGASSLKNLSLELKELGTESPVQLIVKTDWQHQQATGTLSLEDTALRFSNAWELLEWSPTARLSYKAKGEKRFSSLSFSAKGQRLDSGIVDISRFSLQNNSEQLTGSVQFDPTKAFLQGKIAATTLTVDEWLKQVSFLAPLAALGSGGPSAAPTQTNKALSAALNLHIDTLRYQDIPLEDLNCAMTLKNEQCTLPCTANLYGGKLSLTAQKHASPLATLKATLAEFQLEKALPNPALGLQGRGTLQVNASLPVPFNTVEQVNLTATLDTKESQLRGINVPYYLQLAQSTLLHLPKPKNPSTANTRIERLHATFNCQKGICTNDDLEAIAESLRLQGKGRISIVNQGIDYRLQALLTNTTKKPLPLLLKIGGTLSAPRIEPDIEAYLQATTKQQLEKTVDRLEEKLKNQLLKQLFR